MEIDDEDNLLGLGDGVTLTYDLDGNRFEFDQAFNIPNSQTDDSEISVTITPYFEDNGSAGLNGDECSGDPITLNITVRPAPTVTVEIIPEDGICAGETVDILITASEPGTANLVINQGGAPIAVPVADDDGDDDHNDDPDDTDGIFTGTFTSDPLTEMTQFTVNTFVGDVAGCTATVNQMVMTDVEPLPTASIADDASICDDGSATVTFTGADGNGTGFTFPTP